MDLKKIGIAAGGMVLAIFLLIWPGGILTGWGWGWFHAEPAPTVAFNAEDTCPNPRVADQADLNVGWSNAVSDCMYNEPPIVKEIIKEVPVEKEVVKEVIKEVPVEVKVPYTVTVPGGLVATAHAAAPGVCAKHGTIAWQNDNLASGALYGEAPVGGLNEECGVVAQTWTSVGGTERFVFYVPPHTVVWIGNHHGGTGWYFDPNADVAANLTQQVEELEQRDGPMKTTIAVLPSETFRLVTRIETAQPPAPTADEGDLPGDVAGPAIVQWWDGGANCGIFALADGDSFNYDAHGHWWRLDSQTALEMRYPEHKAEYLTANPSCTEALP